MDMRMWRERYYSCEWCWAVYGDCIGPLCPLSVSFVEDEDLEDEEELEETETKDDEP